MVDDEVHRLGAVTVDHVLDHLLAQDRREDRDRVALEEHRSHAERTKADIEFLAREIAARRIATGEVATRDHLRRGLDELRGLVVEQRMGAPTERESPR